MAAKGHAALEDSPRTMREIVQKKFVDEVIGIAAGWKILVMDENATRVISSALTMFDIMERRVTLVEQLAKNRQPFPDMDVIYLCAPTVENVKKISGDFESRQKAKYGNVHILFTDVASQDVFSHIQQNALLVSKAKTFKEITLDFICPESNVFHFDSPNALEKLYSTAKEASYPSYLGKRLANVCITLNEHPSIRFQGNSPFAREIAQTVHQTITAFKRANPNFWTWGDDNVRTERERAQLLILDRSFDCISPLMHEYTYQAMANDLLDVSEGVITYQTTTNKGEKVEKQGLLNESDEFWLELRHSHIAKVIEVIKERMNDIIQNNSGAALAKKSGADLDITTMAAAVKKLPEYTQTMTKLGQHVAIAQQCMDAFSKLGLMDVSQVEQTITTGRDEDGKEVKGQKLLALVVEAFKKNMSKELRTRLMAIFFCAMRQIAGGEDYINTAFQAARLSQSEQQAIMKFGRLITAGPADSAVTTTNTKSGGMMSSFFGGAAQKHAPTAEGEYADTRHVCLLKSLLEQLMSNQLPVDKYPAMGPAPANASKTEAKSVRKFGTTSKFGKKDNVQLSGVRYLVFVAGGVAYPEMRVGYETMQKESREVIIGSTHIVNPDSYLVDVGALSV